MQCTVNFILCFMFCFFHEFVYNIFKLNSETRLLMDSSYRVYSFGKTRHNTIENTLSEKTINTKVQILSDAIKRLPSQEHYYEINGN